MTNQPMTNEEAKVIGKLVKNMTKPQCDYLLKQLRSRYAELRAEKELEVLEHAAPGRRVRLSSIKPKYLSGTTARILAVDGPKLRVEFENPTQRTLNRFGRICTVHASSCKVID